MWGETQCSHSDLILIRNITISASVVVGEVILYLIVLGNHPLAMAS